MLGPSSRLLFGLRRVLVFDQSFMKSQSLISIKIKIVHIVFMIWILRRFLKFLLISRNRIFVSKLFWLLLIIRSTLIAIGLRIHSFLISLRRVSLNWRRSLLLNGLLMWLHWLLRPTVIVTSSWRGMIAPTRHIKRLVRRSLFSVVIVVLSVLMLASVKNYLPLITIILVLGSGRRSAPLSIVVPLLVVVVSWRWWSLLWIVIIVSPLHILRLRLIIVIVLLLSWITWMESSLVLRPVVVPVIILWSAIVAYRMVRGPTRGRPSLWWWSLMGRRVSSLRRSLILIAVRLLWRRRNPRGWSLFLCRWTLLWFWLFFSIVAGNLSILFGLMIILLIGILYSFFLPI